MKKEVKGLLVEIIVLSFIIIINIIIWPNLKEEHLKKTEAVMSYVSNISIDFVNKEEYYLFPMTDEYATTNLRRNIIKITNYDDDYREYSLYLKLDKISITDIHSLKFMFNNKVIDFSEIYSYEDEDYVYYQVYNNNIKDFDYIEYIYWLDSDNTITNVNFVYSLEVI